MGRIRGLRAAVIVVVVGGAVAAFAITASASSLKAGRASAGTFVVANTSSVQKLDPDVITNFLDFQALGLIYDSSSSTTPTCS